MQERIEKSAILQHGEVWIGNRHHQIITAIASTGICPVDGEQGFWTSWKRFVNRVEGRKIAASAGQLVQPGEPHYKGYEGEKLYSEDVREINEVEDALCPSTN
jgi:hypothetical protein